MTTELLFIYITVPTQAHAETLATYLLEKNLIACANLFPSIKSIYVWENKIQHDEEVALLVKTVASRYTDVKTAVEAMHPYSVPCITAFKTQANEPFHNFVKTTCQ